MRWMLVAYQAPAEPSTARVTAWRGLHQLGGLYLGPTVCLLPGDLADPARLEALRDRVCAAGGSFETLEIDGFGRAAEARLEERYNAARAAEYAEVVERITGLTDELGREAARDKFTFAEVEENEADLAKIRRWLRRVIARDLFDCGARSGAETALREAEQRLAGFVDEAIEREAGRGTDANRWSARALRVVNGDE